MRLISSFFGLGKRGDIVSTMKITAGERNL